MKLIKKLDRRKANTGYMESAGLFYCEYCKKEVIRFLGNGTRDHSCGCVRYKLMAQSNTKHGDCKTRLYKIWSGMLLRCFNHNHSSGLYYRDRGITVCNEWMDYTNFRHWALTNGYANKLTIDRIGSHKNYEPENCRWVTVQQNNINKGTYKNNTSGTTGVYWSKKDKKWKVQISANKKQLHLGLFFCFEKAKQARLEAEKKYFLPIMPNNHSYN